MQTSYSTVRLEFLIDGVNLLGSRGFNVSYRFEDTAVEGTGQPPADSIPVAVSSKTFNEARDVTEGYTVVHMQTGTSTTSCSGVGDGKEGERKEWYLLDGVGGYIESPSFPDSAEFDADCYWEIRVASNELVFINIIELLLGEHGKSHSLEFVLF